MLGEIYAILNKEMELIGNQGIVLTNDLPLLIGNIERFKRI